MHKVEEGAANQSYGLQVAQLAGIPKSVVASAKRKLQQLETSQINGQNGQPDMFANNVAETEAPLHPAIAALETCQPDDLTPKQALEFLYRLQEIIKQN